MRVLGQRALEDAGVSINQQRMGFHIPPCVNLRRQNIRVKADFVGIPFPVNHLHLHLLSLPLPFPGNLKYRPALSSGSSTSKLKGFSWFVEVNQVLAILRAGEKTHGTMNNIRVYEVLMRNPQARMHKTWEQDGFLVVKGNQATLKDEYNKTYAISLTFASGKDMRAHANMYSLSTGTISNTLHCDDEIKVGSRDCKIQDPLPYGEYASKFSLVIGGTPSASTMVLQTPQPAIRTASLQRPPFGPNRSTPVTVKPFKSLAPDSMLRRRTSTSKKLVHSSTATPLSAKDSNSTNAAKRSTEQWEDIRVMVDGDPLLPLRINTDSAGETVKKRRLEDYERRDHESGVTNPMAADPSILVDGAVLAANQVSASNSSKGKQRAVEVLEDIDMAEARQSPEIEVLRRQDQRCYLCQWRKKSTRKNPVWEDDGVLFLFDPTGADAVLKNKETKTKLARASLSTGSFVHGDVLNLGTYEIEVGDQVSVESYYNQSVFRDHDIIVVTSVPAPPILGPVHLRHPVNDSSSNQHVQASTSARFTLPTVQARPHAHRGLTSYNAKVDGLKAKPRDAHRPGPKHDPMAEGAIVFPRPDEAHQQAHNKKNLPVVDVVLDPGFCKPLREHQIQGVKFMYESVMGMRCEGEGCILADEMGLGKTIQAIALIWTLLRQSPYWTGNGVIQKAMIVAPVTLTKQWAQEIKKLLGLNKVKILIADSNDQVKLFCQGKTYEILIVGYERLRSVVEFVKFAQPPIGLVVCDEGHRIKSKDTKVTRALKSIPTLRRVVLSGTPIQNDLSEFHTMCDFVFPGCLDTYSSFKKSFERVILRSRDPNCPASDKTVGLERSEQLNRIAQTFMIRRTSDTIARYLPPKLEYCVFVTPTQLQVKLYETILTGKAAKDVLDGAAEGTQQLSLLNVLRKLSTTPGLLAQQVQAGTGLDILKQNVRDMLSEHVTDPYDFALSGKLSVLATFLKDLRKLEEKIVIVSNFTQTLDVVEKFCRQQKYPVCRLDGTTDTRDRHQIVQGFNNGSIKNHYIFLLSSKSGGTGLNIIGASRLVMLDADWNPSTDLQAMARIHRDGQKKLCVIYRFFTAGTIDEKIFQRQITKLGLSGSVMDTRAGAQAKSKSRNDFTLDELRDIFKLHTDTGSQTHDLLECKCHMSKSQLSDGELSDSEDELDISRGFQQASQLPTRHRDSRAPKTKLSMLRQWQHFNCTDEHSVDEIADELLRTVVYRRVAEAADEKGSEPIGAGQLRLRGASVGFVFGQKSSTPDFDESE
ncbi:helicase [Microbotryomycetes sp. JL201]|nr:helicase [Microbotryomycetes sp. JL201]